MSTNLKRVAIAAAVALLAAPAFAAGTHRPPADQRIGEEMNARPLPADQKGSHVTKEQMKPHVDDDTRYEGATQGRAVGAPPAQATRIDAKKLSRDDVRNIQRQLKNNGYSVDVDGYWGAQSSAALRSFQRDRRLETSGEVNQQTLDELGIQMRR